MEGKRTSRLLVALFAIAFVLGLVPVAAFAAPIGGLTGASPQGGVTAQDDDEGGFAIEYQGLEWRGDDEGGTWWFVPGKEFGYAVTYDGSAIAWPQYQTAMYREVWDEESGEYSCNLANEAPERGSYRVFVFQLDDEGYLDDEDAPEGVSVPGGYFIVASFNLYIEGPYPIYDDDYAEFSIDEDTYLYTGKPIEFEYDVWFGYGDNDDEDNYDLAFYRYDDDEEEYVAVSASNLVDIGDYKAVFTGKGDYYGTAEFEFSIVGANDLAYARVEINGCWSEDDDDPIAIVEGDPIAISVYAPVIDEYDDYNWREVDEDAYSVTYAHDDYDMTPYEGEGAPTEPGDYVAIVEANDDSGYTGTANVYFTIFSEKDLNEASLVFDDDFSNPYKYKSFALSEIKDASIDVVVGSVLVPAEYYELKTVVDEDEGTLADFSGFTAVGEYNLVVVPSAAGETADYEGQGEITIVVSADNDLRMWDVDVDDTFEGAPMPTVEVVKYDDYDDEVVLDSKYYSVKYEKEVWDEEDGSRYVAVSSTAKVEGNADYRVTVTGKNGYTGELHGWFDGVSLHDFRYAEVTSNSKSDIIAQGQPLPTYKVTINSKVLKEGTDYEYVYYNEDTGEYLTGQPTEPGEYSVIFSGLGAYSNPDGEYDVNTWLTILPSNSLKLATGSVIVGSTKVNMSYGNAYVNAPYTGKAQALSINMTVNGKPVPASSYGQLITYSENGFNAQELGDNVSQIKDPGYYVVLLAPKDESGFIDPLRVRVRVMRTIDDSAVTLAADTSPFSGRAICPAVTVKVDGKEITDYFNVSYENNMKPGIGVVKVYFYGPYSGMVTKTFVISDPKNPASASDVSAASNVAKMIAELSIYVSSNADVAEIRTAQVAYDALTVTQKALVGKQPAAALKAAVARADSYAKKHQVVKKANPMNAKGKTVKVKFKKLKKKAQKVSAITVSGAQGGVSYKLVKISTKKKLAKQAKKKIKVGADGKIKLGKKLKKGTYKVTLEVKAAGNASYQPATKTVTVKVKVK